VEEVHELPVEEGLCIIGTRFLQTLRDRRQLIQIMFSEMSHYPEKIRRIYQLMIENLARTLESYLETRWKHGEIINCDMAFTSFAFLRVLVMTFAYESIIKGRALGDQKIKYTVNELVAVFLNGIAVNGKERINGQVKNIK
jgi:hypothetical protein